MIRLSFLAAISLCLAAASSVLAASPYSAPMRGEVAGYRLAGIEPDGDPLYQTVLDTTLGAAAGVPRIHLVINVYMENFKPDTVPILPDLLHPKRQASNLGGFMQGKALLTDDRGTVLGIGSLVAEAFLDNTNTAVMTFGDTSSSGITGRLAGRFTLHSGGGLSGRLSGHLTVPASTRATIASHRGEKMRPIEQIIKAVTVTPHAMVGRATGKSQSVPLRTGFGTPTPLGQARPAPSSGRSLSPVTIIAGAGAILSFVLAGVFYWRGRKTAPTDTNI